MQRKCPADGCLLLGKVTQRVLGDDDRAIDDQAKIERAEAHEVRADPALQHPEGCHQHGQRDDESRDERRAKIAEQQEQDGDDQQGAFAQIPRHSVDCRIDQLRAVEDGFDSHAGRKGAADVLHFGIDRSGDSSAVVSDQHQSCSDNHLVSIAAGAAGADFASDRDVCDIADPDRNRAASDDGDVANIGKFFQPAAGANRDAFAVAVNGARAPADVVHLDGTHDIAEREPQ